MKPLLKLMLDTYSYPTWVPSMPSYNINPHDLPISKELAEKIIDWATRYDAILDQSYPPDSKFESWDDFNKFVADGEKIYKDLSLQIGDQYEIQYNNYNNYENLRPN